MYVKNVKPIFPYMQKMNTCHVHPQQHIECVQLFTPLFLYLHHAYSKENEKV